MVRLLFGKSESENKFEKKEIELIRLKRCLCSVCGS